MKANALLLVLCGLAVSACASSGMSRPAGAPVPGAARASAEGGDADRLLVQRVELELETERPAQAAEQVEQVTRAVGGYLETSTTREEKRVSMVLRVPATALDSVLATVERLGEVDDRKVSAVDVTEETVDLEARLANLVSVRDRLRQHLQRAANVQEVITVERELARVQGEIDALEARLKRLRSDVAMSRVALDIHRPRVLGPLGVLVSGVAWVIEKLFVIQ